MRFLVYERVAKYMREHGIDPKEAKKLGMNPTNFSSKLKSQCIDTPNHV